MAYVRDGINAHVKDFLLTKLNSSFIQRNPLLYFLSLRSAEGLGKLGQPKAATIFGGANLGQSKVMEMIGSTHVQHRYQKAEPNDGSGITDGGSTPTATSFADDNVGTTEVRWTHFMEPIKINKHSLEAAKSEHAVGSIVEDSASPVWNRMLQRVNTMLWYGGTAANGSSVDMDSTTEQDRVIWKEPLGLKYAIGTQSNIYGRVDRATETILNPFLINSSTAFDTTIISLDLNRSVNNGYVDATSSTAVDGLANKNPNGIGCNLFITTSALYNELAAQAEARGIRQHIGGIPNHSITGFQNPIIEHDNVFYTWDKDCPSGTVYCIDLDTWLMEVAKGHNFEFLGFTDKSVTEEGGAYYEWGNYSAKIRPSCTMPWLNGTVTNLTTV